MISQGGSETMTYVCHEHGCFGALLGARDSVTAYPGALVDIDGGELYETQILGNWKTARQESPV